MRSFKNYSPNGGQSAGQKKTQTAEELTKKMAQAYNGKSNGEMMRSILSEAEKSKRAGTLSNEEIDAFYSSFAPMLNATQRKKLQAIVERLKGI